MGPRILVIEEHPALRDGYERALREEGYEVLSTASTFGLIDLARQACPDCVVLDPDSDNGKGMDAALRLLEEGLLTSLVFNTSRPYSMESDFKTWVADAYAVRSQGVDDLLRAVQQVLPKAVANS
jgi:DNA-binding NarL/FixJ family response regulator